MLKIMIVDDMDIVRRELKRLKIWGEKTGFVIVQEAKNGYDALRKLDENIVDLVVTDIKMPKIDGIELLKIIKDKKLCPCVVIFSDYSEFSYAREGLVLGAFDYMVKPVNEEDLINLLQRAKEFIIDKRYEEQKIDKLKEKLEEKVEAFFPQAEVNQIIEFMKAGNEKSIEYACRMVDVVYLNLNEDLIKTESLLNNVMYEIINSIFKNYTWVNQFISNNEIKTIDFLGFEKLDLLKKSFMGIIEKIINLLQKLQYGIHGNDIVNQVCKYALENIDGGLSLKSISEKLYINKSYISEVFKQKTGVQFIEYLTAIKMERAKKLITDSRLRTYEIAGMLGFKDIEYFSKLFKKYIGCSPTEYRNNFLDNDY